MIFRSDFLRADVVDVHKKTVGWGRDLIVRIQEPSPVVTAVVLRPRGGAPESIAWQHVRAWDDRELALKVPLAELTAYPNADSELWLARDVLDKQIVDTDGRRVVRVNDLQLQERDAQLLLVGVDIGARGLMRRLGVEQLGRRIRRVTGADFPQRIVSWDAVDPVESDARSVRLRISHQQLSKLHPPPIPNTTPHFDGPDPPPL